jgi:hypothetical protein
MRVYLSVLKLRLNIGMQYRTAALAGIATNSSGVLSRLWSLKPFTNMPPILRPFL